MHLYHPQALAAERVRDRAAAARRGRQAPCIRRGRHTTGVVCLHASASSGRQWRALESRLTGRYQVLAPDLYGSGDAPPWPDGRELSLADEVALVEPVFEAAGESFHLIGHSYGGAVAAAAAVANPARIRSLVLIEPVLFGLLLAEDPGQSAVREIAAVRDDTSAAAERGALDSAAERFTNYWMGPGAWTSMPLPRKAVVAQAMRGVRQEWSALFTEATPLPAYSSLDMPTLYLVGSRSPSSARAVARLLSQALPDVTMVELPGAGHMAPITHPDLVNAAIEAHITQLDRASCGGERGDGGEGAGGTGKGSGCGG